MCGVRQGELLAMRWLDADWKARVIRLRRNNTRGRLVKTKSRRSTRSVPMPRRVAAELRRLHNCSDYTGDTDLVFCHPDTGSPYDASKMRKRFKDAVADAGVRPVRFHDLRHTFGTRMAGAGAPLRFIQEWMGHRDYKTTEIYADFAPDPSQEAGWAEAAFGDESDEEGNSPDDRDPDSPPETEE
jgi:integrase